MKLKYAAVLLLGILAADLLKTGGNRLFPIIGAQHVLPVITAAAETAENAGPEKLCGLTALNIEERQVSLSWEKPMEELRYRVYLGETIVAQGTGSRVTIGNLDPGTEYVFTVTAVDSLGVESPHSTPITVKTTVLNSEGGILRRSVLILAVLLFICVIPVTIRGIRHVKGRSKTGYFNL